MVIREAREFFDLNDIPALRVRVLSDIYRACDSGEIKEFWDIEKFLEDFPDGDDGEHVEGMEIEPMPDAALDDDGGSLGSNSDEDDDLDDEGSGQDCSKNVCTMQTPYEVFACNHVCMWSACVVVLQAGMYVIVLCCMWASACSLLVLLFSMRSSQ